MKDNPFFIFFTGVILFCLDRWLKFEALYHWHTTVLLGGQFGWELLINRGIAFGLPFPSSFVIIFTIFVLGGLLYYLVRYFHSISLLARWAWWLVFVGAVSNLIDRITYGVTVDYWRLFSSIFNLADVLIITGFVLYFLALKRPRCIFGGK